MLRLIRKYPQLLLFGILTAMFSSPGQTFLISFFLTPMREEFGISQGGMGMLYFIATTASALLLPFLGHLLDRTPLLIFTLVAGFLLAAGCRILSQSTGIFTVLIGFLLVRNLGQGTLTLISVTTMARVFGRMRGKALGIANLGYPLSEAIFPFLIASWIAAHGWRSGWILLACLTLVFFAPLAFLLLRRNPHRSAQKEIEKEAKTDKGQGQAEVRDASIWDVLRNWRIYVLLLPMLLTPGFLTALFFHQGSLMAWKGWDMQVVSLAFVTFAAMRAIFSFSAGALVDRFSARRIYPLNLLPLAIGIICLWHGSSVIWAFFYLGFCGMTIGLSMTISGALWAELYGIKYLGSIRGFLASLIVLSTGATPPIMGFLLDAQVDLNLILSVMLSLIALGCVLAWIACRATPVQR